MKKLNKDYKKIQTKFHYYLSNDKIYKEVVENGNSTIFGYNYDNSKFDIPVNLDKKENFICEKLNKEQFYSKVLDVIKRTTLLGYMASSYKNKKSDFKDFYSRDTANKTKLSKFISDDKKIDFTKMDVRILVDRICKSTKIPLSFIKEIKNILFSTFHKDELLNERTMIIVNKIIEKELLKKLPDFMDKKVWELEYQKMMKRRKKILSLYAGKER